MVDADGEDENSGNNNLDDEWEYINDNLTVVSHDCAIVVYLWCECDSLYHRYLTREHRRDEVFHTNKNDIVQNINICEYIYCIYL